MRWIERKYRLCHRQYTGMVQGERRVDVIFPSFRLVKLLFTTLSEENQSVPEFSAHPFDKRRPQPVLIKITNESRSDPDS